MNFQVPLACLLAMAIFPNYCMLNGFSSMSILFHIILTVMGSIYYLIKTFEDFKIMLNDNQHFQIIMVILFIFLCILQFSIICFAEKWVEEKTWELATTSFDKSEQLTKEIIKVAEMKDVFMASLSCEMKNSLSSIREGLKYLIQVVQKPNQLEELNSISLNVEVLQNMISNMDLNQTEVLNTRSGSSQLIEKAVSIHADTMRRKNISTQAFIDKCLPKELWTDTPRILQIIINLVSDALEKNFIR